MQIHRCNTTMQTTPNFGLKLEAKDICGLANIAPDKTRPAYEEDAINVLKDLRSNHISVKLDIRKIKSGVYLILQGLGIYRERIAATTITKEAGQSITQTQLKETLNSLGTQICKDPMVPPKSYSISER